MLCIEFAGLPHSKMLADVNVEYDNLIHSLNLTSVCSQIYILKHHNAFLLTENESAFDLLYCITFKLMDQE